MSDISDVSNSVLAPGINTLNLATEKKRYFSTEEIPAVFPNNDFLDSTGTIKIA